MTKTPEQLIAETSQIKLNAQERSAMRHMLQVFVASYVPRRSAGHVLGRFFARHAMYGGFAVMLMAGATTALAHRAVPGDVLYPVKLSVNDRVAVAVAGGDDARLDKEMQQIGRIVSEEETAADIELQDELDNGVGEPESQRDSSERRADAEASLETSTQANIQEDSELGHELRTLSAEIDAAAKDNAPEQ